MEKMDVGVVDLVIMALIVAFVLLGTVFKITMAMSIINFGSPFFMIFAIISAAIVLAKRDELNEWQITGQAGLPPGFIEISLPKDALFYKLLYAGYFIIVVLLVASGHWFGATIWAVIWLAVIISHTTHKNMYNRIDRSKPAVEKE